MRVEEASAAVSAEAEALCRRLGAVGAQWHVSRDRPQAAWAGWVTWKYADDRELCVFMGAGSDLEAVLGRMLAELSWMQGKTN